MKTAILFFGLVAMCQGLYLPEDNDKLTELLNMLRRVNIPEMTRTFPNLPRFMATDNPMMPPEQDPLMYDLDQAFEFPGSTYLVQMIMQNFSDPAPLYADGMQDFPEGRPPCMDMYMRFMEPRWQATMSMFHGDYTGLPEFFTRRFTEWIAKKRFACPSTYFDKIFARWSFNRLVDSFTAQEDSMLEFFRNKIVEVFPNYEQMETTVIAQKMVYTTHWWIVEEMMQHIFGYGFQDVGVFSHKFHLKVTRHFQDMNTAAFNPNVASHRSLWSLVQSALYESRVKCQTGMEVLQRYGKVISMFKTRYEQLTVDHIATNVASILVEYVPENERATRTFDQTIVNAIALRIRQYVDTILADFAQIEMSLTSTSPDVVPLRQFMDSMLKPEETGLMWNLFQRLGLITEGKYRSPVDAMQPV